jgi:hypothetical protein
MADTNGPGRKRQLGHGLECIAAGILGESLNLRGPQLFGHGNQLSGS